MVAIHVDGDGLSVYLRFSQTPWLCGYLPVSMLTLAGTQTGELV